MWSVKYYLTSELHNRQLLHSPFSDLHQILDIIGYLMTLHRLEAILKFSGE